MIKFKEGYYADVRIEDRFTTSIGYRNGQLEESKTTTVKKAFIRVFDGEMWYYSSTYKLDDLQGELEKLYSNANYNAAINDNPIVKKFEVNRDTLESFKDISVRDIDLSRKQALLTSAHSQLAGSEYVKMYVSRYADRHSYYEFYSSKGACLKYDYQHCGAAFMVSMANGEETYDGNFSRTSHSFDEIALKDGEIAKFIGDSEEFLLKAKPVTPGVYPVILSPLTAGVFAHESFGHKSEADFMVGDETMRKEWALGAKVGSDILSIYDCGEEFGSGYVPYDDEGTKTRKTYLIKNGVLSGRLHSATTAVDLNEELTGNARACSSSYEPIVRMSSTVIEGGSKTKEELFAGVKHGYYIDDYKHGSGMSTFTIAPNRAYEIIDGKIAGPVKIAVITGNVFETLNLIDGLSDRVEVRSSAFGGCGKMEQYPLNVSFGGPYVSISKMNVQ
ncbi:MAG: TldD/PmbA family protein [Candidatus Coproplasma sp.]